MGEDEYHVAAFVVTRLCTAASVSASWAEPGKDRAFMVYGQWREVNQRAHLIECDQCKLVIIIIRANKLEWLFNSDQRKLAAEFKRIVGR